MKKLLFLSFILLLTTGCETNRAVDSADTVKLTKEGTVTFARPTENTIWFGSYSQKDLFDIVYQDFSRNSAGQTVVKVGIRYRGPTSWTNWNMTAQEHITISARCDFYSNPGGQVSGGPIVYSTNNRAVTVRLGETYDFQAVCPVKNVPIASYHVTLSED